MAKKKKVMTESDWDKKYTADDSVKSAEMDGESQGGMFETYGTDITHVVKLANTEPRRVWTAIDGEDGRLWWVAGYHMVNRVYYIISKEEWESEDEEYRVG